MKKVNQDSATSRPNHLKIKFKTRERKLHKDNCELKTINVMP